MKFVSKYFIDKIKRELKMLLFKYWLLTILTFMFANEIKADINMTQYKLMPPLYVFDDYGKCFDNANISFVPTYCLVYAEITPDNASELWLQIQSFSEAYKFHYRHDHLFRGLCLNAYNTTKGGGYRNYSTAPTKITNILKQIFNVTNVGPYQYEINQFLNEQFFTAYNLSLETLTLYCDTFKEPQAKDFGFKFTSFICLLLIILNIVSSLYDSHLKSLSTRTNRNMYYRIKHTNYVNRYLTLFSMKRNFHRLLSKNLSCIGKDFGFLDGIRAILSLLIVYEHLFYFQCVHLKNPEFFENLYHEFYMKFLLHGMVVVELFFVLSGLMLYLKTERSVFVTETTSCRECIKIYGKLLLARYMRYLPSLCFLILFNTNLILHLQRGPFWRFMMESNAYLCQKYWWKNVLMFNNFDISNSCLSHTWYIAADFQLYALYLLLLAFVSRYPKFKLKTWIFMALLSAALPVLINYALKLDSIAYMTLESFRYFYLIDIETGAQLYIPSYTNLHGFLTGILCGVYYMRFIRKEYKIKTTFRKIINCSPFIGLICIAVIFYVGTLILWQEPSFLTALFGLLQRHVTVIILSSITIVYMMHHKGRIFKILSSTPFRLLARLSYQVYLWHFIIVLMFINYFQQPINMTFSLLFLAFIVIYLLANMIALILTVMIELPITEMLNLWHIK